MKSAKSALAALCLVVPFSTPVNAATAPACDNGARFSSWLSEFKQEAVAEGIPARVVQQSLAGIQYDPAVIKYDRGQAVFSQAFSQFAGRMVSGYRLKMGAQLIKKNAKTFQRIEREYGVPAAVLTSFWGLETDFGANTGKMATIQSVATLAYDCRRPEMFREELKELLRIIARGDLSAQEMRGPWAGELGQFQFLPRYYLELGVDYDGDGRVNLLKSTPDALASAANLLRHFGWRAGEPWLEEVVVPADMDWHEADVTITHPVSYWLKQGVKPRNGQLAGRGLEASLLLPMGRKGPAFLAYSNFQVYLQWNQSLIYSATAAYFASRLAGAPIMSQGRGDVASLEYKEIFALQKLLVARGFDVGEKIDGIIGAQTREAVRQVQMELGLPADGYPDQNLLAKLRR